MAAATMHHFGGLCAPFMRPKGTVSGGVFMCGWAFTYATKEVVFRMASRIAGITVEIGGDTTKLSKALEGVNKSIITCRF